MLHAVVYDKDPKDATPCIYDSIHDIPRAVPSAGISSTNPRIVVLSDDTDTTGNSDTGGSFV